MYTIYQIGGERTKEEEKGKIVFTQKCVLFLLEFWLAVSRRLSPTTRWLLIQCISNLTAKVFKRDEKSYTKRNNNKKKTPKTLERRVEQQIDEYFLSSLWNDRDQSDECLFEFFFPILK